MQSCRTRASYKDGLRETYACATGEAGQEGVQAATYLPDSKEDVRCGGQFMC
jgi:hypothetical protein